MTSHLPPHFNGASSPPKRLERARRPPHSLLRLNFLDPELCHAGLEGVPTMAVRTPLSDWNGPEESNSTTTLARTGSLDLGRFTGEGGVRVTGIAALPRRWHRFRLALDGQAWQVLPNTSAKCFGTLILRRIRLRTSTAFSFCTCAWRRWWSSLSSSSGVRFLPWILPAQGAVQHRVG